MDGSKRPQSLPRSPDGGKELRRFEDEMQVWVLSCRHSMDPSCVNDFVPGYIQWARTDSNIIVASLEVPKPNTFKTGPSERWLETAWSLRLWAVPSDTAEQFANRQKLELS